MGLYDFTFYDVVNRNAICFKEKIAWQDADGTQTLTYAQYNQGVDRLAAGLQKLGVRKGNRIAMVGRNCLEYFLLYGSAAALGAIIVPINWRLAAEEINFNLNDCKPQIIFVDKEFQEIIERLKKKVPFIEKYFNLGAEGGQFLDFMSLIGNQYDFQQVEVSTDDGFIIIYTAAISGNPRGALLSHGNIICANMNFVYLLKLTPQDVHLNVLPFFHLGGLITTTAGFHAGSMTVNMKKFDASNAVRLINEKRVSIITEFSPILSSILEYQEKTGIDIKSLRAAGGLDNSETIEKYQRITGGCFYVGYGQTETSSMVTFGPYNEKPGSAGRMVPLSLVKIVDDHDREVSLGQLGEIIMKGPMVFKGYWNLQEENKFVFRDAWHHTGDLGRFDDDGFLWYAGRKAEKELIKTGGENVYPAEVEKVILMHSGIKEAVVIGVPDTEWGEAIKAVCVPKKGNQLTESELVEFVGQRIARFKKPKYVVFVPELPKTVDGFLDRNKVKEKHGSI